MLNVIFITTISTTRSICHHSGMNKNIFASALFTDEFTIFVIKSCHIFFYLLAQRDSNSQPLPSRG